MRSPLLLRNPFAAPPSAGKVLCAVDDFGKFPLPEYVRLMPRKLRQQWMEEHHVRRVVEGDTRLPDRLAMALGMREMPRIHAAYSLFEMMQPFMIVDAPAVTAAAKNPLTQDTIFTLPANVFPFNGKTLWFHAAGVLTTTATPGTYTFTLNWGGSSGTVLATTGAIVPWAVVNTNTLWYCDFWLKARAVGGLTSSLTLTAYGQVQSPSFQVTTTQSTNSGQLQFAPPNSATPGTALADITGLDQTVAKALTLAVTPTVTTGSIACRDAWVVAYN